MFEHERRSGLRRALAIGAKGYVSKTGDPHDLVEAMP